MTADSADDGWEDIEGSQIPLERVPEELRVTRHRVRNVKQVTNLQAAALRAHETLLDDHSTRITTADRQATAAMSRAEEAMDVAKTVKQRQVSLEHELWGHPDRKDDAGIFGEMTQKLAAQTRQNYAILLTLLGLIVETFISITRPHF